MFYSHHILTKKGPLGKVWMAATMGESKISKSFATTAKIHVLCKNIENPSVPFALRLSASLMLGVVRVYSKKSTIILADVNCIFEALKRCKTSQERSKGTKRKGERSTVSGLPDDNDDVARFESITLPLSKKRRTRTYAPPTRSESRSQASRKTESLPHLSSSYLGETGEIDVMRAMETVFPSVPVPRLGEHLPSGLSTPSTGYRSGNQKSLLYKAREQDITMAATMDNLDFGIFDQDMAVSNHSEDPQSAGSDGLLLIDNGNAEDFAAAFGSQFELEAQERHSNEVNRDRIAPHIPDDGFPLTHSGHDLDSKENTSLASGPSQRKKSQKVASSKAQRAETFLSKSFADGDQTEAVAKSAIKRKKSRRAARVFFDQVTELPPSHIRSCLSDANDITLDEEQSRATETRSRRSMPELNFFSFSGTLSAYPQQIVDLWKDVTANAVGGNITSGHGEQSLSSLRMQDQDAEAGNTFSFVQEHRGGPSFPLLDSPLHDSRGPIQPMPSPEEVEGDSLLVDDSSLQKVSAQDDVPNAEVLRAGDSNGGVMQPDLGSLSAPSHSASGPSTFSGKSNQFHRDAVFDEVTADDKRLYETACQAMKELDPDGDLNERRLSQSPYPKGSSRGDTDNAERSEGSPGDGRLDVRASDFELVEETEKPEVDPNKGKGPIERIGIRGYKVLQMLRSEAQQKRGNIAASSATPSATPSNEDANIITFDELTANCSRGACARAFFHVLNLSTSGYVRPTQEKAYGAITLHQGVFF